VTLLQQDIRALDVKDTYDMVLALDVMNELDNLKDLETVFRNVHAHLGPSKLFIFDLHTVGGLAQRGQLGDQILTNEPDLNVFLRNVFDYERQAYTGDYIVFQQANGGWQRQEAIRVLRGYPTQAVATLLRRCGFEIKDILDEQLQSAAVAKTTGAQRAIFAAVRQ
jgi:SAM-dependent methyltransferase